MEKSFVEVFVPILEKSYDTFIPRSLLVGQAVAVLKRMIASLNSEEYTCIEDGLLCNHLSGAPYDNNVFVWETDISNGSKLMLI